MKSGVYIISNIVNGKMYIGQAINLHSRFLCHVNELESGTHFNEHLQRAWNRYSARSFSFSILEEVSEDKLTEREQHWLDIYDAVKNGYNLCPIAESRRGAKMPAEARQKLSRINMGHGISAETRHKISEAMKGRSLSAETRAKMSAAKKGKQRSKEHQRRLSEAMKGKKHSVETRQKISESHKGIPLSDFHRQGIKRSWTPERKAVMSKTMKAIMVKRKRKS